MRLLLQILCIALFLFWITPTHAQHTFVVQNITTTTYESLTEAYENASSGDTIYLPGGLFSAPSPINKSLTWIGVGHYPDSTTATNVTQISNIVNLYGDTDGSFFTGIFFNTTVNLGEAANNAENITFKRCRLPSIFFKQNSDTIDIGLSITECVLTSNIYANNASNVEFEKNLVFGNLNKFQNTHFNYNDFCDYDGVNRFIRECHNCLFTNNVFANSQGLYNSNNCYFNNNIIQGAYTFPNGTNNGTNNITGISAANFFQTITGNIYDFSYDNNYHLQTSDPTWATFSTDGTEPGIYGSSIPYKEGAVPFNPHIRAVNIDQKTTNGILPVQITVVAQDN